MCGECCRAGYDVNILRQDVNKWEKSGKTELVKHIIIDYDCLSINHHSYPNFKGIKPNELMREKRKKFKVTIKKLEEFIQNTHLNYGIDFLRNNVKIILNNYNQNPILGPKNFDVMMKGLEIGLRYKIRIGASGICPFLDLNSCSIQDYKPIICKKFPFTKDNCLRNDDFFKSICKAINIID